MTRKIKNMNNAIATLPWSSVLPRCSSVELRPAVTKATTRCPAIS